LADEAIRALKKLSFSISDSKEKITGKLLKQAE